MSFELNRYFVPVNGWDRKLMKCWSQKQKGPWLYAAQPPWPSPHVSVVSSCSEFPPKSPNTYGFKPLLMHPLLLALPILLPLASPSAWQAPTRLSKFSLRIISFIRPFTRFFNQFSLKICHVPGPILVTGEPKGEQYMVPILKKLPIKCNRQLQYNVVSVIIWARVQGIVRAWRGVLNSVSWAVISSQEKLMLDTDQEGEGESGTSRGQQ